jgi:hypothetical protein
VPVAQVCNTNDMGGWDGGLQVKASLGKKFMRQPHLNQWADVMVFACHAGYMGRVNRRMVVQVFLSKNKTLSTNNEFKPQYWQCMYVSVCIYCIFICMYVCICMESGLVIPPGFSCLPSATAESCVLSLNVSFFIIRRRLLSVLKSDLKGQNKYKIPNTGCGIILLVYGQVSCWFWTWIKYPVFSVYLHVYTMWWCLSEMILYQEVGALSQTFECLPSLNDALFSWTDTEYSLSWIRKTFTTIMVKLAYCLRI